MIAEVVIKSYPEEAQALVEIWNNHAGTIRSNEGIGLITFTNRRPKRPQTQNRRIAGIEAKAIAYLRDNIELVSMSVENYLYLMAKVGVEIEVKEKEAT